MTSHRCHCVQGLYGTNLEENRLSGHSPPFDVDSAQSMYGMTERVLSGARNWWALVMTDKLHFNTTPFISTADNNSSTLPNLMFAVDRRFQNIDIGKPYFGPGKL